jgi:hypothetical protein
VEEIGLFSGRSVCLGEERDATLAGERHEARALGGILSGARALGGIPCEALARDVIPFEVLEPGVTRSGAPEPDVTPREALGPGATHCGVSARDVTRSEALLVLDVIQSEAAIPRSAHFWALRAILRWADFQDDSVACCRLGVFLSRRLYCHHRPAGCGGEPSEALERPRLQAGHGWY